MKLIKILSLVSFSLSAIAQNKAVNNADATVFTYGNNKVTVQEFTSVYKKNSANKTADFNETAVKDYLKLYENFKLKVAEGKSLRIDTLPTLKMELNNYRKQLAKNYLMDKEVLEKMYKEAYNRSLYEVHAAHIMIKLMPDASPKDTLAAYEKINKIYTRLITKKEDFALVAKETSEDGSAKTNGGDVGYFSALQTFYPFENATYNLVKVGDISKPFRTKVGYHIVKLIDKRPSRGQVEVQHILISAAKAAKPEVLENAKNRINNIYKIITNGKDFSEIARDSSDDKVSAKDGGKLPIFGAGKMVQEFEDVSFNLKKVGDVSTPFQTDYGFHIVKLISKKTAEQKSKDEIKKIVEKDARVEAAKASFINKIKTEYRFTYHATNYNEFVKTLDSSLLRGTFSSDMIISDNPIFTIDSKNYTVKNFAGFLDNAQRVLRKGATTSADVADKALPNWIDKVCNDVAESKLELKYTDFKNMMNEYAEGVILFDITDKNVWSKAVNDTTGLKLFYNDNAAKYMWAERLDAEIFRCANEAAAALVKRMIEQQITTDSIKRKMNSANSIGGISVESGKFEKGSNKIIDKASWAPGIQVYNHDDVVIVANIKSIVPPTTKKLEEARGYVIADYQEQLEKSWLNELRKKYPITENQAVIQSLIKK